MKALTIRKLPEEVADAVQQKAEDQHLSLSKAIIVLLEEHLAEKKTTVRKYHDMDFLFGTWTAGEAKQFDAALKKQRRIDPKMWK